MILKDVQPRIVDAIGLTRSVSTPWEWLGLYVAVVLDLHLVVIALILLFWPVDAPIEVWDFTSGVVASALVALLAGVITIMVSSSSSKELEQETVKAVTKSVGSRLEDSLSAPVTSVAVVQRTLNALLESANESREDSVLIMSMDPEAGFFDEKTAELLSDRLHQDWPTWLVSPVPNFGEEIGPDDLPAKTRELWTHFTIIEDTSDRFDSRRFLICPAQVPPVIEAVLLLRRGHSTQFDLSECVIALKDASNMDGNVVGLRTSIDMALKRIVAKRICNRISEPGGAYSKMLIQCDNIEAGVLSGIPVTRSLVTSQILIGLRNAIQFQPGTDNTQQLYVYQEPWNPTSKKLEFRHDARLFLPPITARGVNHSGSVIAKLLAENVIDVEGKGVLEVGCGPGYLSLQIAKRLGKDGYLLANDISDRALGVARLNLHAGKPDANTFYIHGDCNSLQFEVDSNNSMWLFLGDGSKKRLDVILVELPLLAYKGTRQLHQTERPYMEVASDEYVLPPSLEHFLGKIGTLCLNCKVPLVLPICASDDSDLQIVMKRLSDLTGSSPTQWSLLGSVSETSFVKCMEMKA